MCKIRIKKIWIIMSNNSITLKKKEKKIRMIDYNDSMSKIMLSNVQEEGEINISFVKITHNGIKCNKCEIEPISGYRYKCSICKNYNLYQKFFFESNKRGKGKSYKKYNAKINSFFSCKL